MKAEPNDMSRQEKAQRVAGLIAGYLRQTLTEQEHDELDAWVTASDNNQRLFEELITPSMLEKNLEKFELPDEAAALEKIKGKLEFALVEKNKAKHRRTFYTIAASLVLLAGIAIAYQLMKPGLKNGPHKVAETQLIPGVNQALLTLDDGRIINLREAKNGLLDSSAGVDVLKTADGQLSYESNEIARETTAFHVLSTPRGGQYSITLPDGSRVWLNAVSSLKYPVVFGQKERVVELNGEGFFDIAPLLKPGTNLNDQSSGTPEKIPFRVKLRDGASVMVMGTSFNVMSYEGETEIRTTLLEGRVRVECEKLKNGEAPLHKTGEPLPGGQAVIKPDGDISIIDRVNTDEAIAWKNGQFKFINASIETIMRQVERWYDAEVKYEGKIDYHFNATIYRNEPLARLLALLEKTRRVKFTIEGKRITVSQRL